MSFAVTGFEEAGGCRRKRKKLEDDDVDPKRPEEGRALPLPPGGSRPKHPISIDRFVWGITAVSAELSIAGLMLDEECARPTYGSRWA